MAVMAAATAPHAKSASSVGMVYCTSFSAAPWQVYMNVATITQNGPLHHVCLQKICWKLASLATLKVYLGFGMQVVSYAAFSWDC